MNIILKLIKKVILAICIVYCFNLIASGLDIIIPLNVITISLVTILGIPGLISLIVLYFTL